MTVHQLLNGVIYAGALTGAVSGIGVFAHFAFVRPVRSFLRREIVGSLVDIKDAVERSTTAVSSLETKLEEHIANGGHLHT